MRRHLEPIEWSRSEPKQSGRRRPGANLSGVTFNGSTANGTLLVDADLTGADLSGVDLVVPYWMEWMDDSSWAVLPHFRRAGCATTII